jgi:hypothetical protein
MAVRVRIRLPARRPRRGFFTLTAEPRLRQDETLRGYLDYIIFKVKTSGGGLYMWHARKNGNLIEDFSTLVPKEHAIELVRDLYQGRPIKVPGRHPFELLEGRFDFTGEKQAG